MYRNTIDRNIPGKITLCKSGDEVTDDSGKRRFTTIGETKNQYSLSLRDIAGNVTKYWFVCPCITVRTIGKSDMS
jgi:hypothetical protein